MLGADIEELQRMRAELFLAREELSVSRLRANREQEAREYADRERVRLEDEVVALSSRVSESAALIESCRRWHDTGAEPRSIDHEEATQELWCAVSNFLDREYEETSARFMRALHKEGTK